MNLRSKSTTAVVIILLGIVVLYALIWRNPEAPQDEAETAALKGTRNSQGPETGNKAENSVPKSVSPLTLEILENELALKIKNRSVREAEQLLKTLASRYSGPNIQKLNAELSALKNEIDKRFKELKASAERQYEQKQYADALQSLNQALAIKRSADLHALRKQIDDALKSESPVESDIKKKKSEKNEMTAFDTKLRSVGFLDLPVNQQQFYIRKFKRIELKKKGSLSKIGGQLSLIIGIDAEGKASVKEIAEKWIQSESAGEKERFKQKLIENVQRLVLPPPTDLEGTVVKLEQWRINYKILDYYDRTILLHK